VIPARLATQTTKVCRMTLSANDATPQDVDKLERPSRTRGAFFKEFRGPCLFSGIFWDSKTWKKI